MCIHHFFNFQLAEYVFRFELNTFTPPMYLLYNLTASGQGICDLVPSLMVSSRDLGEFAGVCDVVYEGNTLVILPDNALYSFYNLGETFSSLHPFADHLDVFVLHWPIFAPCPCGPYGVCVVLCQFHGH